MLTATANVVLPTTIIGSLPRPGWYTQNLGRREFREAMVDRSYREQYLDAGREFDVPMPLTSLTRDLLQQMIGQGMTEQDFSTLLLMQARASGIELKPENVQVGDGLAS